MTSALEFQNKNSAISQRLLIRFGNMALAAIWRGKHQRRRNLSCSRVAADRQRSRGFQISHQFSPLGAKIQFCLLGQVLESQKSIFNF